MTTLQAAKINLQAESVIGMLKRELEFEYVGTRSQFVTGLLAFVIAQGLRLRLVLRRHPALASAALCFLLSSAFGMLTYHNAHTISYGGYTGLLRRWSSMSLELITSRCAWHRPSAVTALITFTLSVLFGAKHVYNLLLENADSDGDGKLTGSEVLEWLKNVAGQ